jgi:alpha-tubulin suppressor-like RCC1 family protein
MSACARTTGGDVLCWGTGENGQLGNGMMQSSATPVKVVGLPSSIVQLSTAALARGTCAASTDGRAWCWGRQMPGGLPGMSTPEPVLDSNGPIAGVATIRPASTSVCALLTNGTVACSGANDDSQLGRGACDNTANAAIGPVVGLPKVIAIDGRWLHTCALDEAGKVFCWGDAQDGALGLGDINGGHCTSHASSGVPTVVPGLPHVTQIATGLETTFAVTDDGRLWAWGVNDLARIGHPPKSRGDLVDCGDVADKPACNPTPMLVEGLP